MTTTAPRAEAPPAPGRRRTALAALVAGLLAAALTAAGSWRPSMWFDEAATASAVRRSPGELLELVGTVDVVHAVHYALTGAWAALAGTSPLALRLPSAVAVGAATAGVLVLGRLLAAPERAARTGVVAAACFVLLPRVTWMATEARSYALSAALVTWWTVALVLAARRGGRWWLLWAGLGTASVLVFLHSALVLAAHAVTAPALARRVPRGLVAGSVPVVAATLVLGAVAAGQYGQVAWLPEIGPATLRLLALDQFFYGAPALAVLAWGLAAAGALLALRGAVRGRAGDGAVLAVALPWLVLPPLLLVVASVLHEPLYYPRYVGATAGALALLLALALTAAPGRWTAAAGAGVLAALAAPAFVEQRTATATAKQASDWALVAEHVETTAREGDAVVWGPLDVFPADTRAIAVAYPGAFAGLADPTLAVPATGTGTLWATTSDVAAATGELADADRVLAVRAHGEPLRPDEVDALARAGFTPATRWQGPSTHVVVLTR
ncbi:glycosyltransferase family 39 protein [Kineococcus sp. SYSU DK004]|uniref:glycosyltransferase family 39 protein n=1 Tax=Kineococcus sp. SYSU DK004 TaxID=3383125 RepID=UPI003D7CB845